MTSTPHVVVVGGGLAGLVAARHLAAGGVDVTLLEREETVGGRVRTLERDGYRFDRGFQVLFTAYPAVKRELDLEALDLRRFAPGAILARPGHRSTLADPVRDPRALPATLFNRDVSFGDKLRVARLRVDLARVDPDEIFDGPDGTIEAFLRDRGFSERFIDNFAAPFYGGICLDRTLSTSKRVFEYTFQTLAAGDTVVPAAGMEAIPIQLARYARDSGATLETDRAVEAVESDGDGGVTVWTTNETLAADAVIVATDPPTARELTGVESIPTTGRSCVTQYYRLPGDADLETGKRLVLNASDAGPGGGPNQVVPHSAVAPEYAPDDATLLSATYLGEREESDEQLAERTRETLESWFPERLFGGFESLHTERIPFAQFDQPPGAHDGLPDVRDPEGRIYLAGDYTRWSSIQGAMESGRQAAGAVLEDASAR
ncbi:NAD(P)/FAD-dependent oxidoreductase [Natrarchaeobaculum sulfurireducens]|uniref:Phytoene dehydrogenase n=1 Tax=Natrarchaeobaculum sulfurireducens TaxID=2044521 RepID=A0A346PHQ9_9EURY|nr:NAD(P)/FAD-dependent oxidoreductase [Natrarchaeobaculum sulfurireducens]AXR79054.1 Phytoene dehydrogenase [Natrarchaeobaculum sulfurireducens]